MGPYVPAPDLLGQIEGDPGAAGGGWLQLLAGPGAAEGAADPAVQLHPMGTDRLVPEALHPPRQDTHVGGASHRDPLAPDHVVGGRFFDRFQADFRTFKAGGTFGHEAGHFTDVAGFRIEQDEDR
jgi:hypothetical protein